MTPVHLKATINSESQFAFLRDIVATIPDIQAANEEDALSEQQNQTQPSIHNKRRVVSTTKSTSTSSSRSRGRGSKLRVQTERLVSREEEEDEDMDEETEGEEDGDSCDDNSETKTTPTVNHPVIASSSAASSLPSSSTKPLTVSAADLVDDDYDDVWHVK